MPSEHDLMPLMAEILIEEGDTKILLSDSAQICREEWME
jgi:hypothetical protein